MLPPIWVRLKGPSATVAEHKREASTFDSHFKSEGHEFDSNDVTILVTETRWFQRGIKEAYYIATLDSDINQDKKRHTLSPVTALSRSHVTGFRPMCHMTSLAFFSTCDEISRM